MNKKAFTMIELIFVIIILGILATIAIPKFAGVSEQAIISNGHSDVMAIRTAISTERQKRLMQGSSSYISSLDKNSSVAGSLPAGSKIFDSNNTDGNPAHGGTILTYAITTKDTDGGWMRTATNTYKYKVSGVSNTFTYDPSTGIFDCTGGEQFCPQLTK